MKKSTNSIEYSIKGGLTSFDEDVIHTEIVGKNDVKIDEVNLEDFINDIRTFCQSTIDRNIEMKFSIRVIDEE